MMLLLLMSGEEVKRQRGWSMCGIKPTRCPERERDRHKSWIGRELFYRAALSLQEESTPTAKNGIQDGNCSEMLLSGKMWMTRMDWKLEMTPWLVLATVPGYPAAVRVWNWTGSSTPGCYPENRGTHRVWGQVGTGLRFHITVPSTLAPIKYLSSDRIVTWSVRRLCNIRPSFTSRCQICDWSNIRRIAVKEGDISGEKCRFSIATQWILVRSQMWEREAKEGPKLHNLHTDHVTIRSELRYLIGAKIVDLKCRVFGENPLQQSGSGSELHPELNQEIGPVPNTTWEHRWGLPESLGGLRVAFGLI